MVLILTPNRTKNISAVSLAGTHRNAGQGRNFNDLGQNVNVAVGYYFLTGIYALAVAANGEHIGVTMIQNTLVYNRAFPAAI
jgi:hypothetical protein